MSSGVIRTRVLSVYHKILRLARDWKALEPANTAEEQEYIRQEARTKFRDNKEITDPVKIRELLEEAEGRIAIARHYRVPYERPAYLPPGASYDLTWSLWHFQTLTRSERSLSLGPPSPASCPIRAELLALGRLGGDVREFVRCYLAGSVISNDVLSSTWSQLTNSVVSLLFQSSLLRLFPPKHQYEIATLKRVIAKLECNSSAPPDCLYERLCYAIASPTSSLSTIPGDAGDKSAEVFHRVFVNFEMKDFVVIRENAEQISGGTTGLSCWQAACVLAEFFCCGALAQIAREHGVLSLHLLELGAGCGLTGLALAKFNRHVASLTLTDHNERVLERLHENFRLNAPFSAQIDSGGVRIHALDWQDHDCVDRLSQHKPDVVYAADVVYDPDLITPFCTLLAALLVAKSANSTLSLAFVACTIRNAETLKIFRRELLTQSLRIRQEFIYQPGQKCFIMDDGKSCYCFDEAMFPSASTLLLPVVILEICAA